MEEVGDKEEQIVYETQTVRKLVTKRRPSERITLQKLKKQVVAKDGMGMTAEKQINLD